jgi:hypothetical protein
MISVIIYIHLHNFPEVYLYSYISLPNFVIHKIQYWNPKWRIAYIHQTYAPFLTDSYSQCIVYVYTHIFEKWGQLCVVKRREILHVRNGSWLDDSVHVTCTWISLNKKPIIISNHLPIAILYKLPALPYYMEINIEHIICSICSIRAHTFVVGDITI